MPSDVRSRLEASAGVLLGSTKLSAGTRPTGPNSPGWARRVLANLEAHVATGVALSEESRQALEAHQAAMRRLQVGDRVAMDGDGNIIPAGTLGAAIGVVSRIGEGGQVEVTRLPDNASALAGRTPWYTGPTSLQDLQQFRQEYMNEPPAPSPGPSPNPSSPGALARAARERAFAAARPASPRPSELPATVPPASRTDEERQREAQQRALAQLREAMLAQRMAANSPPPPPPNPLQHAETVVEGRPKRRVLRKKKNNE